MLDRLAGRLIELIDRRSWMRRFVFVPALLLAVACDTRSHAQTAPLNAEGSGRLESARGAPPSFADLAARLSPAVVNISTTSRVTARRMPDFPGGLPFGGLFPFPELGRPPAPRNATSLGSGFLISADGYVVTNNHVVAGRGAGVQVQAIKVTLTGGQEYPARVVGRDEASDLAVLKIEANNLPFVRFGDSPGARTGDWVLAIGNPYGLGGTVTAGIVSALHRDLRSGPYDSFIQTDASINSGNSGGPLFDMQGNVIGINTAIISPTGGNVGLGFAIPAEIAKPVVDTLRAGGRVRRGYLGLLLQPVTEDVAAALGLQKDRGEIVAEVQPNLPAARAGLQQGDVILRVNGTEITPENSVARLVAAAPVGSRVTLEVLREGARKALTAVVAERPAEASLNGEDEEFDLDDDGESKASASAGLGLSVRPLTPALASELRVDPGTQGLVIVQVDPSSDAAAKGLSEGDIILSINQQAVRTAQEAVSLIAAARKAGRKQVLLLVKRGSVPPRFVGIELSGKP
nr:Do family serine endopeptidase [Sphingomonas paucimobilis]